MKFNLIATCLLFSVTSYAKSTLPLEEQISSIITKEVSEKELISEGLATDYKLDESFNKNGFTGINTGAINGGNTTGGQTNGGYVNPNSPVNPYPWYPLAQNGDRIESAGRVISVLRDMVALGETIYQLVQRGKPTNVTEYAPISVVPRDPLTKEYLSPFDLEGFSMPVEKNFMTKIKNGFGKEVVKFAYKVMYSYGGSYEGKGRYLTSIIIIPSSVVTKFGWDFSSSMKLSGIMNHGSKLDPVAGAMITIKYNMNSWSSAHERNDTIHISGSGEFKSYMNEE